MLQIIHTSHTSLQTRLQLRVKIWKTRIVDDFKAADPFNQLPSLHAFLQSFADLLQRTSATINRQMYGLIPPGSAGKLKHKPQTSFLHPVALCSCLSRPPAVYETCCLHCFLQTILLALFLGSLVASTLQVDQQWYHNFVSEWVHARYSIK